MTADRCFCNVKSQPFCCVLDCRDSGWEAGCYPCHTKRGNERCLHTGEKRDERGKGNRA